MEDLNSLYSALEKADAAGDVESAKALTKYIQSLPTDEEATPVSEPVANVEQPQKDLTQAPVVKPAVSKTPIDVMGKQFTPEEYAKYSGMPIAAKPGEQAKGNFSGAFGRSIYNLAADLALEHGKITGNYTEAEETAKRLRDYGDRTYTSTTKSWREDPLAKIQELAGGSAPYMIAPIAAAIGGTALGATGIAAVAAPLITSAVQFTGSNLQRQMEDNKKLADTSLLKAGLTAIPQAALDQIGFRFIPGVQKLFGIAGIELTEEAAKKLLNRSIISRAGEKALELGEALTVEGATEAAQQLLERLQAGLSIKSPEALQEYFDSFVGGAVLAGGLGGAHHVIAGVANKVFPSVQTEQQKEKEVKTETPAEEKRASHDTLIKSTLKELEDQANQVNQVKADEAAQLKAAQQKQVVTEATDLESMPPANPMELTDTTLTSWGLSKNSKAYKTLIGQDVSTPEGRVFLDDTLDAHTGKINEKAVDTYKSLIDQQKAEATNGTRTDTGTVRINNEVSGQPKYGTPGATEGYNGPAINISGTPTQLPETGEKKLNTPLETVAPVKEEAPVKENKPSTKPISNLIDSVIENGKPIHSAEELAADESISEPKFDLLDRRLNDIKALLNEYLPLDKKIQSLSKPRRADLERRSKLSNDITEMGHYAQRAAGDPYSFPMTKIGDLIARLKYLPNEKHLAEVENYVNELKDRAKNAEIPKTTDVLKTEEAPVASIQPKLASQLRALDSTNPLIEALQYDQASEEEVAVAQNTIKELQASRKAKKVDLTKAAPDENLLSQVPGDEEGKAIVNTTKPASTLGQALSIIKRLHFNKLTPVQKVLHGLFESMPNVLKGTYKVMGLGKGEFGQYKSITNKTIVSPEAGTETIYHEGTHAATVWAVRRHVTMKNGRPVAKTPLGQKLVYIFDAAEVAAMQADRNFKEAFTNMEEFVSYAYNNKEFQRFLAEQRSVAPTVAPKTSLWSDLMDAFTRLLGIDISNSLMSDIVSLTPDLMTGERPTNLAGMDFKQDTLFHRVNQETLDRQLEASGSKYRPKVNPPTLSDRFKAHPVQTTGEIVRNFRKSAFSFDHAINQKILAAMRKAGVSVEEYAKSFYQIQISQAVKSDQMADLFMIHGDLQYDPRAYKFVVSDVRDSMTSIRNKLSDLAKKYGVSEAKMYEYASAAFIARRSRGLIAANNILKQRALNLMLAGKKAQAQTLVKRHYKLVHLTASEIKAGEKFFNDFKDARGNSELDNIFAAWNKNREHVLNFAKDQGLYSEEDIEDLLNVMDYVPFYRDAQIEAGKGPKEYARGLLDAAADKRLKGSYQPVNNVFDNMERWTRYVLRKSINNRAAQEKIRLYSKWVPNDIKVLHTKERSSTGNIVNVWQDGKLVKYEFQGTDGKSMVDGFTGLEPVSIPLLNGFFRPFANFLRMNIVLQPVFSIAQIPMDMYNAIVTSKTNYGVVAIPLQVIKEIMLTPLGMSAARNYLKTTGTVGKHDFSSEYDRIDIDAMHEAKKAGSVTKLLKLIAHPFGLLAMASDNVIRQAVYSQVMLESGDRARAVHMAEEIINFRRTGSSGIVNIMRQNAPFVNANLQSLHIAFSTLLNDGIDPDTKAESFRRLVTTGASMFVLSMLYAVMNHDDDKYKELDPTERDRYLIIPGSNGYKLPLRNDIITLLFKTLPEHLVSRYIYESEDSTKMLHALKVGLVRALMLPSGIPTVATPAIEAMYNIDTNTGRPIIGKGQENLEEDLQYSNKYTSQLSREMGDLSGVSPAIIQHFFDRYFGTTTLLMGMITNGLVTAMRGEILPEKTTKEYLLQIPSMSSFVTKEHGTRNINDYYELNDIVTKIVRSAGEYQKRDFQKYQEYLAKDNHAEIINMQKEMAAISKELQLLRAYENKIYASKDAARWTPASKKTELEHIEKIRQDMLGSQLQIKEKSDRYIQQLRYRGGL